MSIKHRDKFQERIYKGLIGPGSDSFGLTDEEEIISDYPLQRYSSAIIFPAKKYPLTESEEDELEIKIETEEPNNLNPEEEISEIEKEDNNAYLDINFVEIENKANQNNFYPNNIGLTFCIEPTIDFIDVEFSGGFYNIPEKQSEIKIKIPEPGYQALIDERLDFPFKDILVYENGFLSLSRELKGDRGGKNQRSGEYLLFDEFKKTDNYKDSSAKYYIEYFQKLIGRIWKRKPFSYSVTIEIKDTPKPIEIPLSDKTHKETKLGYNVKTYYAKGNKYVKIQLVNTSKEQSSNRFTPKTPELNSKCLFQAKIKVKSDKILPYKSYQELNPFDTEAEELNFLYREVKSFGIGHNCSVTWNSEASILQTTFLPEFNVKNIKNEFNEIDFENPEDFRLLNQSLDIKNLSIFSIFEKTEIIKRLENFVGLYKKWIEVQKAKNESFTPKDKEIGERIINRLNYNYNRLKANIDCLNDEKVFRAFQLANTAMLIQIIISNDKDFTKHEKEISQVSQNISYNDLKFFSEYDYSRLGFQPKYRPFQLAFLLLNIKGITKPHSDDRKNVVDLIWFPTGGGKTEAYLAVTAFTIIWRRMSNDETASRGVSVIMRYTLRLLTAQQFERASKLIASLEFLRKNFTHELKNETISIGLWVGNQLTPGKIEDAKKIIDEIEKECQKKNGSPVLKNTFQISSCPWCGTKLISEGDYGFDANTKSFKIKCLNKNCTFYSEIPVQVVDEMLYLKPPTLLFATVDKFAQLAWKGEAHKFFNSLDNENLPPDLIIQDELHLLSGPLGSIFGLFESVVEKLCTKENQNLTPKIIASTATTRNTTHQIQQLYGGRMVNIFPPSGLNYSDNFFAKESKEKSRRKYIGFMPVGKTAIDTQLQIIAHLLVARIENKEPINDNYWTVVSYYNSLKDVGKIRNKVGDEIIINTSTLQSRLFGRRNAWTYNHFGLEDRTEELTARVESNKIKTVLKQLENRFELVEKISERGEANKTVKSEVIDLLLATNMFSVGIDIGRLNLMLINGMPKNIAEYIQASSRVGRIEEGLIVTFLNPTQARDKSYFEHFIPFHQSFYKSIEPLSVTPFTENTIDKMLTTIMVTYVRHKVQGLNQNNDAQYFKKECIEDLKNYLKERFPNNTTEFEFFKARIDFLANDWTERIKNIGLKKYSDLLKRPEQVGDSDVGDWIIMQSMREVDDSTFIQIKESFASNPR
ncbi:MAG: helicase-related protein [Patescibacteria group bacterium]|nr:helicase-related protein [Patescibacteria group bacterium]